MNSDGFGLGSICKPKNKFFTTLWMGVMCKDHQGQINYQSHSSALLSFFKNKMVLIQGERLGRREIKCKIQQK